MVTSMYQGLLMFRTFLVLVIISALISGCGKSGNVKWLHYNETNCADKWEKTINNEGLKDNVVAYLDKQGVKVLEIEIFTDIDPDTCTDCTCKTGRRFKIKVKKRDVSKSKSVGFYE
jgi:hypothetical protein